MVVAVQLIKRFVDPLSPVMSTLDAPANETSCDGTTRDHHRGEVPQLLPSLISNRAWWFPVRTINHRMTCAPRWWEAPSGVWSPDDFATLVPDSNVRQTKR